MSIFKADELSAYDYEQKTLIRDQVETPLLVFYIDKDVSHAKSIKIKNIVEKLFNLPDKKIETFTLLIHFHLFDHVYETSLTLQYQEEVLTNASTK